MPQTGQNLVLVNLERKVNELTAKLEKQTVRLIRIEKQIEKWKQQKIEFPNETSS